MSAQEIESSASTGKMEDKSIAEARELKRPVFNPQRSAMQSYRLENFSYEPPPSPTSRVSGCDIAQMVEHILMRGLSA